MAAHLPREYSPFTPGLPVPVEFFVGRHKEIKRLTDKVAQAAPRRLQVAFVAGERGIGKSSLTSFARVIAERDFGALSIHTFLGGVSSVEEMVRRIFDRLANDNLNREWYSKIRNLFGDHIRNVGLFGVTVEFQPSNGELRRLAHDFAPALRNLMDRLRDDKKTLVIVIDDINGLADSPAFANWLKSLVDEIATAIQPLPLCLVLVGLEERRQSLIKPQPSLARVFDVIDIRVWTESETRDFLKTAFAKVGIEIDNHRLKWLAWHSGGLPVLAHEIGDAVFKANTDDRIDLNDAVAGVIAAAEIVGRKYLEPQVLQAIRSPKYRAILRKVAGARTIDFTRSTLLEKLDAGEAKVLDNILQKMRTLGVINADPESGRGAYRFHNSLHRLYFSLEAERSKSGRV
ncbi:MAG: AAA family ATPase [Pseudomonadota bacterium]